MKSPGRNHPAGRDRSTSGHRGRRDSSNDDAYCSAKVEYRTSSTPAYTDELDLHYSTNNAPTTTQVRSTLRLADNPIYTHDWCTPTNSAPGPHSALRTTTAAPIVGAHPRTIDRGHSPHCGQLRLHQQPVLTHEPRSWRSRKSSRRRFPTWANSSRRWLDRQRLRKPPPRTSALRTTPGVPTMGPAHETAVQDQAPHCGQHLVHQQWGEPINRYTGSGLELRRLQGWPGLAQSEFPFAAAQRVGEFQSCASQQHRHGKVLSVCRQQIGVDPVAEDW